MGGIVKLIPDQVGVTTSYGTDSGNITVTSAASVSVFGSWTQILASLGARARAMHCMLLIVGDGTQYDFGLDIGTGAAASETSKKVTDFYSLTTASTAVVVFLWIPLDIASGTRIAARLVNRTNGSAKSISLSVTPENY